MAAPEEYGRLSPFKHSRHLEGKIEIESRERMNLTWLDKEETKKQTVQRGYHAREEGRKRGHGHKTPGEG